MTETYKIVSGKYNPLVALTTNKGVHIEPEKINDQKLQKSHVKYDLRKYCFTNCVLNILKNYLDHYCQHHCQQVYDFQAHIH